MLDPVFTYKQRLHFAKILMKYRPNGLDRICGVIPGYGFYWTNKKGLKKVKRYFRKLTKGSD